MAALICLVVGAAAIAVPINAATGVVTGAGSAGGNTSTGIASTSSASSTEVLYDGFDSMQSGLWKVTSRTNGPQGTNLQTMNVWVSGGRLTVRSDVKMHTGGEYQSKNTYGYGLYSANIKTSLMPGSLATFFTYRMTSGGYNEIDMQFEKRDGKNYVYFENAVNGVQSLYKYQLSFDPSAAYHTYAFNWQKGRLEFYVDDLSKPVWVSTSNVPDQPSYVLFNNWVSKSSSATYGISYLYVNWVSIKTGTTATVTPTPTKVATATPTPTKVATATPTPTKAPTATPTALPPATPTKAPTATPTATPVPTKAPTATPTTTPVVGEPAPSSKYALYDNFNADSSTKWSKRSNTWDSSFAYTIFKTANVWYDSSGKLVLRSYVNDHTGGEYKSNGLYSYGKYRASIKLSQTTGTFETFYSYQWPASGKLHNEIDIELIKNADGSTTAMLSTWVDYKYDRNTLKLSFDPSAGYHTYGYNWYSDRVEFYIDDKLVWTSYGHIPDKPMYVYFQNWVVKDVPSSHGDGINTEYVDWVTVEQF
jgi:beta-glucanase (GH16 family)